MLSKYTAVFLVPSTLLLLLWRRPYRRWLVSKEPYLALLIAALLFVPVILWNVEHDWASFGFQLNERLNRPDDQPLESLGEFLLTQIVVSFPALLAGLLMISVFPFSLGLIDRRIKWHFCFLFSLPFLAFLLVVSVHSRIKANWTLPGYLSLLVAAYPCYRHLRFNSGARMKVVAKYSLAACLYALPVMYLVAGYHLTAIPGVRVFRFTTG